MSIADDLKTSADAIVSAAEGILATQGSLIKALQDIAANQAAGQNQDAELTAIKAELDAEAAKLTAAKATGDAAAASADPGSPAIDPSEPATPPVEPTPAPDAPAS